MFYVLNDVSRPVEMAWIAATCFCFAAPGWDVALEPESPDAGGVGYRCLVQRIASTAGETTSGPIAGNDEPTSVSFSTTEEIL